MKYNLLVMKISRYFWLLMMGVLSMPVIAEQYRSDRHAIEARIKPHGRVVIQSTEPVLVPEQGQEESAVVVETVQMDTASEEEVGAVVYDRHCGVCHEGGIAGAPLFRDTAEWQDRVSKGMPTLLEHVVNGYNAMPVMGTCMTCSEEQLQAAIEYMLPESQ